MKIISVLLLMFLNVSVAHAQKDTLIGERKFEIMKRFPDGRIKEAGQFADDCSDGIHLKHGTFISYNKKGAEVKRTVYFYNTKRYRKVLGLKHGTWGFYGINERYFMGIKSKRVGIVDPCF